MKTVAERIKIIRENYGKSQKDMASELGISLPALQGYEAGKSIPGGKAIEALVKLGFNANWLLTGEGEIKTMAPTKPFYKMILAGEVPMGDNPPGYAPAEEIINSGTTKEPRVTEDGFVKIPRYRVDASAGHGAIISSEQIVDHLAFRADWVRHALGVQVAALALINVIGDSMEPTLSNGDLILIDTGVGSIDDSGIYVLQFDGKLKVKRIHSKVDGSVDLISDNARYPIETIQGELAQGLNVVGRVVWCGRRM